MSRTRIVPALLSVALGLALTLTGCGSSVDNSKNPVPVPAAPAAAPSEVVVANKHFETAPGFDTVTVMKSDWKCTGVGKKRKCKSVVTPATVRVPDGFDTTYFLTLQTGENTTEVVEVEEIEYNTHDIGDTYWLS